MSERVHVIEDGVLPADRDPEDWVVFVDSTANAAMWLGMGEPIEAFTNVEGVVGFRAYTTLLELGWPVEYDTSIMPKVRHSGHLVRTTFDKAIAHAVVHGDGLTVPVANALTALETLVQARGAIEAAATPDEAALFAEVATRGALMGFAAVGLGVAPERMVQPSFQSAGGVATAEKKRAWWPIGAERAEALAAANPDMTLAAIGRKVHAELLKAGLDHVPKTPEKVAERLRALGRSGDLRWPPGSVAAE